MSATTRKKSSFPRRFSFVFSLFFLLLYWPGFLGLGYNGVFQHAEDAWHDRMFVLDRAHLRGGDPRIVLIALDEETGNKYGFPLPRKIDARILDALKARGAAVAVFDIFFLDHRPGDRELVAATKRFGRAIHLYEVDTKYSTFGNYQMAQRVAYSPVDGIAEAAWGLGFPNVDRVLDEDGHLRSTILFDNGVPDPRTGGPAVSVDAVAFSALTGVSLDQVRRRWGTPLNRRLLLCFRAPRSWLRHPIRDRRGRRDAQGRPVPVSADDIAEVDSAYRRISALDLLRGTMTPEQKTALKGALAVIGSTSLGYYDHYPTPFIPEAPGAEFHCNVIDNLLHDDFFKGLPRLYFVLAIIALIWLPMLLLAISPAAGAIVTGAVLVGWWLLGFWGFRHHLYVEFIAPSAALLGAFLGQTVHRMLAEGAEKKAIKGLFGQFVAPEVVEDLANDPGKARLGGERREMTMLFLDIAHFTTISEKMPPEELIPFLNRYLSAMSQVMLDHKAVVGNYIGDCIMAFWNAPVLPVADHRVRACLAAIDAQAMVRELNRGLAAPLPETPAIRIGINSGLVTVGMTGSEKKLQYTTLGDEVNLSSRLEGANKFFGSSIMASESTYLGARDAVEARELGLVRVVGKEAPVRVFELLGRKGELSAEWQTALKAYNEGLAHFARRDYEEALRAFRQVVKIFPGDGPANFYLNAARDYAAIPPAPEWNGVFNLTAK
ncbi:MAG: CHASE2 domain-containing protein [Elusimicrobia bacterium]|nr:CHASE2 domain-containing protein [Elusimicrobiota bacterium]MDE2426505.1 CHASE2 domain-containing protein [Elusimicrobiota bacterium]